MGLSDPPILHIIIDLGRLVRVQSFAYVAKALMVSKSACIKVAPPKIFIEFGIVRIQKLEVMSQGFGAAKKEETLLSSLPKIDTETERKDFLEI